MIEKLRRKLIIYTTLAVFALLALILSAINIANFFIVASRADEVTSLLASCGGNFDNGRPDLPPTPVESTEQQSGVLPPAPPGEGGEPFSPINPETRDSTRYFTVSIDQNNVALVVKMAFNERSVTPEEAITWAQSLSKKSTGWSRTSYRYRVYTYQNLTYVSVIDFSKELSPSYNVLWGSLIGSLFGVLITLAVIIPVSKLMVKPLQTAMKKQQRFIADASHELKTPLTIISANNEIIEVESGESESTRAISKQVDRLTAMVKNLNVLARLEDEPSKSIGHFDLAKTANDVVTSFAEAFKAKGIDLQCEIPDELPFDGDQSMLAKLISIFMDNALKYAQSRAEFHLYRHEERVCIKVRNDAKGIPDGSLDRVFERFYRTDDARASGIEGSGIGLSIAKQIVLSHGGRISAKGSNGNFVIKAQF